MAIRRRQKLTDKNACGPETADAGLRILDGSPYWLLATFFLFLSACSPTYVLRAGYEEAKILWYRRPIAEVLARPGLDSTTREKLEMVLRVRQFVEQELDFKTGGSYQTLTEIAQPPIVYVVTASSAHQIGTLHLVVSDHWACSLQGLL